jgi:hypothetical protein
MATTIIPIIKGDRVDVDTDYRDALRVNMYAIQRDIYGAKGYIINYPGINEFASSTNVDINDRGGVYNDRFGSHFRVSGNNFIEVDESGNVTTINSILTGAEQVAMPFSFNTQCIISNFRMFLYDTVGGFREVTDPDLGNPIDSIWIDGYYFLTDGENIYHTDITDESAIDPLKFATAEFMPDRTVGLTKTEDNKVIVWGRYSAEYFVNAATANFAFRRLENRAQKIGIVATHAKVEVANKVYITGGRKNDSLGVHVITLGNAIKVSTKEIDEILNEYTEPELTDMRMEKRMDEGSVFIIVHLPKHTLLFNETISQTFGIENAWSILKSDITGDSTYRGINAVYDERLSQWIIGDKIDNRLGILDDDICTQYGDKVEWLFYSPLIELEKVSIDELELRIIPGFTTTNDATVAVSHTTEGYTYSSEYWDLYGDKNQYEQRFIQRRLGYARHGIGFKFRGVSSSRMAFSEFKISYQ